MVMIIMSVLAAVAVPQLQKQSIRAKETQLRRDLNAVRTSIDRFHSDWRSGDISQTGSGVSRDGYPTDWDSLTDGVTVTTGGGPRRYLRDVPDNPFATDPEEPWLLLGHTDPADAKRWNGIDIFDLRVNTDRVALDGSNISDW